MRSSFSSFSSGSILSVAWPANRVSTPTDRKLVGFFFPNVFHRKRGRMNIRKRKPSSFPSSAVPLPEFHASPQFFSEGEIRSTSFLALVIATFDRSRVGRNRCFAIAHCHHSELQTVFVFRNAAGQQAINHGHSLCRHYQCRAYRSPTHRTFFKVGAWTYTTKLHITRQGAAHAKASRSIETGLPHAEPNPL